MMSDHPTVADRLTEIATLLTEIRDGQPRIAYSAKQAGRQLGDASDSHVRTLIKRGDLAKVRHVGSRVIIAHRELERFAAADSNPPHDIVPVRSAS